jgi:hypothetical protein
METTHFYNTVDLPEPQLKIADKNAEKQEDVILNFFRSNATKSFTPFDVQKSCKLLSSTPITSIRRAITNLTLNNRLVKTNELKPGEYGKPNYTWKLRLMKPIQQTMF